MRPWNVIRRVCVGVISLVAVSCADTPGTDPYALFDTFSHEAGLYTFKYLSPPWRYVDAESGEDVQLFAIEPYLKEIDTQTVGGAINAQVKMVVSVEPDFDDPRDAADFERARWDEAGAEKTTPPTLFDSAAGHEGFETAAVFEARYLRAVFQALPGGGVVAMRLVSRRRLDDADMTLILKSLAPGRDGVG